MERIREFARHYLNTGHLYCRFCDLGIERHRAKRWAIKLDGAVRAILYINIHTTIFKGV